MNPKAPPPPGAPPPFRWCIAKPKNKRAFELFLFLLASCSVSAACQHHHLTIILATTQKAAICHVHTRIFECAVLNAIIEKVDSVTNMNHGQNM
jgi:hypothetical protein